MARSKYINTFDTTAEYDAYIESAIPEFPNVGYDKQAGVVNIRRQSPNDYQIWGTTTATENFNIQLNRKNVEVTVDPDLGEFYLTGWTGTLTDVWACFDNSNITSIKKFTIDTSNVTSLYNFLSTRTNIKYINFNGCDFSSCTTITEVFAWASNLEEIHIDGCFSSFSGSLNSVFYSDTKLKKIYMNDCDFSGTTSFSNCFYDCSSLTDVYIDVEATLMKLTNNLTSQGTNYIPSNNGNCTIHYNDVDYKWQNNAWTPQS